MTSMLSDVQMIDGVPEINPANLQKHLGKVRLIDVRRPEEFNDELGHIVGAEQVVLGPDLQQFLEAGNREDTIVFVCRSGGRSGRATMASQSMGYKNVANMTGGMMLWNQLRLPVERA